MSHQLSGIICLILYLGGAFSFGGVALHYELKKAASNFDREMAVPQCMLIGIFWPLMFPMWLGMQKVVK